MKLDKKQIIEKLNSAVPTINFSIVNDQIYSNDYPTAFKLDKFDDSEALVSAITGFLKGR